MRSRKAFGRVFGRRLCASDQWIILYVAANDAGPARLGIAAGRRLGSAVRRNRLKRLVREAFRRIRHELPAGVDYVVVPKPGPEPTVANLQCSIRSLAGRLAARLTPPTAPHDK